MTTNITPTKLWFFKRDLELAANRLNWLVALLDDTNQTVTMPDLLPITQWIDDLETKITSKNH